MLIVCWNIFEFKLIEIILFVVFNAFEWYLDILWCGSSALSKQICDKFSFIYLSDAFNWESPEDLLTDHNQDLAFVHTASIRNKGEWNLKYAERLYFELAFWCIKQSKHFFSWSCQIYHLDTNGNVIFEWISEFDWIRMLLHKTIINDKWWEWNWRQTHTAEIILPITNFFGSKLNVGGL